MSLEWGMSFSGAGFGFLAFLAGGATVSVAGVALPPLGSKTSGLLPLSSVFFTELSDCSDMILP